MGLGSCGGISIHSAEVNDAMPELSPLDIRPGRNIKQLTRAFALDFGVHVMYVFF